MKKLTTVLFLLIAALVILSSCNPSPPDTGDFECEFDKTNKTASIIGYNGNEENITVPSKFGKYEVTTIERNAFSSFYDITSITLPDTVKEIKDSAFEFCVSLKTFKLPKSLEVIGNTVFSECRGLENIYIPSSVKKIGVCVFTGCTALETIEVSPDNEFYCSDDYGVLMNKEKTVLLQFPAGSTDTRYRIEESITSIDDYAFEKSVNLEEVTLPAGLKKIGAYAFQKSGIKSITLGNSVESIGDLCFNESKLMTVDLGKSLKAIGNSSFGWCSSLSEIAIPATVKSIGSSAFYMCGILRKITVDPQNQYYTTDGVALFDKEMTTLLLYPVASEQTEYKIPSKVKEIAAKAFSPSMNLVKVSIPGTVDKIGSQAFALCPNLTEVIYEGKKPSNIANDAFDK